MLGAGAAATRLSAADYASQEDRERRMKWWHEAKFGMFIHWGLYSVLGRHEWVMESEGIPVAEYERLAKKFQPTPNAARAWAKLAKSAGLKYMVMTSKKHGSDDRGIYEDPTHPAGRTHPEDPGSAGQCGRAAASGSSVKYSIATVAYLSESLTERRVK